MNYISYAGIEVSKDISPIAILNLVSEKLEVSIEQLMGKKRDAYIVEARHIFCNISKKNNSNWTLARIGDLINKDHSTVIHSNKTCEKWKSYAGDFKDKYNLIESSLIKKNKDGGINYTGDTIRNFKENETILKFII